MGLDGVIDVVGRAMTTYQNSVRNLQVISAARRKMAQEEEDRAFEKKKQNLQLEDLQRKGELTGLQFDILKAQASEYQKQQEQIAKGKEVTIKQVEHKEKNLADQALGFTQSVFRKDPQLAKNFLDTVRFPGEVQGDELQPTTSYGRIGFKNVIPKVVKPPATREQILSKVADGAELTPGEQQIYDESIRKPEKTLSMREQVLAKKANGETLTAGEKDIYSETIARPTKSLTTREQLLAKKAAGQDLSSSEQVVFDRIINRLPASKVVTNKDILTEAKSMAKADGKDNEWRSYIPEAQKLLNNPDAGSKTGPVSKEYSAAPDPRSGLSGGDKLLTSGPIDTVLSGISKLTGSSNQKPSKIKVKGPDGRIGYIPRENLEKAKRRGFTVL